MTTRVIEVGGRFAIEINGEVVAEGFLSKRMAERAVKDAERQYSLEHDPDYLDFQAYKAAVAQVKFWKQLRASIGETASAENIATTAQDMADSYAKADEKIAAYEAEALQRRAGAWRWADECGIQLPSM